MRLVRVERANFRKSEATNFREIVAREKLELRPGEVLCIHSMTGEQLVFVWRPEHVDSGNGSKVEVLSSRRLRLEGGRTWNPLMLVNYAESVGLKIENLRRFEQHWKRLTLVN
jgi:hypothetical protein